jgi:2-polyprenyl-3-methyl-5-hydroxy-6-metoxy-1,4-benzoquinol methylase
VARLISAQYRRLNRELHAIHSYGAQGGSRADAVRELAARLEAQSILDYGCGKGGLGRALGVPIAEYDPAIPEHAREPSAADLVVCSDVLEHIEPECLDAVLDHLQQLTRKVGYFVIATRKAHKLLPNGRNAHLIIENREWWVPKLEQRWAVRVVADDGLELIVEVTPR